MVYRDVAQADLARALCRTRKDESGTEPQTRDASERNQQNQATQSAVTLTRDQRGSHPRFGAFMKTRT